MATETRPLQATAATVSHHRFTVEEYERMGETGILRDDARVELIHGEIVEMTPIGEFHASVVARLNRLFEKRLPDSLIGWPQNPIVLDNLSQPQPDYCLVTFRDDFYLSGKPRPADVRLLIEVADSSIAFDRGSKKAIYAAAGIEEYWIVNLESEVLEVNLAPRDGLYTRQAILARGEAVTPSAWPDITLSVDDILGPPLPTA